MSHRKDLPTEVLITACIALSMTEQWKAPNSSLPAAVTFELIRTGTIRNIIETNEGETIVCDGHYKVLVYKGNELKKTLTNEWKLSSSSRSKRG